jgi:hypothetical protein
VGGPARHTQTKTGFGRILEAGRQGGEVRLKPRTIKLALRKKFDDFCASITDEEVRKLQERDPEKVDASYVMQLIDEMF